MYVQYFLECIFKCCNMNIIRNVSTIIKFVENVTYLFYSMSLLLMMKRMCTPTYTTETLYKVRWYSGELLSASVACVCRLQMVGVRRLYGIMHSVHIVFSPPTVWL